MIEKKVTPSEYLQEIFAKPICIPAVSAPNGRYGNLQVIQHIDIDLDSPAKASEWVDSAPNEYLSGIRLGLLVANEKTQHVAKSGVQVDVSSLSEEMAKGFKSLLRI